MKRWAMAVAVGAGLGLAACGTLNKKEPPPRSFTGTPWEVVLELPLRGDPPSFRFGDGRMEGFGGCNQVTARYVQDTVGARAIVIGRLEVGRRACDVSARVAEERVLEVLQAVSSYTIIGDTMIMSGSAGSLKFKTPPLPEAKPAAKP
ncbi:MAG TPA: META domain-containing protein [Usitatibacter sp.]|nr:META domain-containing protein [Usitatibacter sp.]